MSAIKLQERARESGLTNARPTADATSPDPSGDTGTEAQKDYRLFKKLYDTWRQESKRKFLCSTDTEIKMVHVIIEKEHGLTGKLGDRPNEITGPVLRRAARAIGKFRREKEARLVHHAKTAGLR